MTAVSDLHAQLCDVLARAEKWSRNLSAMPDLSMPLIAGGEEHGAAIGQLRTRAASTLINVAMFGAFSSGKSFLVSGLQGQLEVIEVPISDGLPAEKFIGLLPSSPKPTSCCPAQVVPVEADTRFDTSGRGFFRVRFTDSPEWEDITNSPAPAVVAAYAMAEPDVSNRLSAHRKREVAEVEILLSSFKIPAKLYDLPGYGSPMGVHDSIIKTAMNDTDCFIFVTRANRTLAEEDLDLIRFLYAHCRAWRKRVIWVLTGIDAATQLDYEDIPEWRTTISRNNQYLEENFLVDGQPDLAFIGEGFIPVSPASEARAALYAEMGNGVAAGRHAAASQMDWLRQILRNLIDEESGRKHIADIADSARSLVAPRSNAVTSRLQEERIPIDELATVLAALQERLQLVDTAILVMRTELEQSVNDRVKHASRPFNRLGSYLHSRLDPAIRSTDIRSARKANQIQVKETQVLQAWLEKPGGPATLWDDQLTQFQDDVYGWVRRHLGDNESSGWLRGPSFDKETLDLSLTQARRTAKNEIVQRAAVVVGISAPIAATATWIGTTLAASAVFPPAAAVAGAAALIFMAVQVMIKNSTSLQLMQQDWIAALDDHVKAVQEQFELSLGYQCILMIDNLADSLGNYRIQLEKSIERIRDRVADPQYQMRQEFVAQLEPFSKEGEQIVAALYELSSIRPEARC
jgi:hypothetical protein